MRLALPILALPALVLLLTAGAALADVNADIVTIHDVKAFDELLSKRPVVVVDFFATWCAPCKLLAVELDGLVKDYPGKITVARVDVDQLPDLALRYQVDPLPVLVLLDHGKETKRKVGMMAKAQLATWLGLAAK